jgi:hypothetical protein
LPTVLTLRTSLAEAATALLTDNIDISELVTELDSTIAELEKSRALTLTETGETELKQMTTATFEAGFDLLLKFKMLKDPSASTDASAHQEMVRMAHFANRSTESLIGGKAAYEKIVGDLWNYPKHQEKARGPAPLLGGLIAKEMLKTRFVPCLFCPSLRIMRSNDDAATHDAAISWIKFANE